MKDRAAIIQLGLQDVLIAVVGEWYYWKLEWNVDQICRIKFKSNLKNNNNKYINELINNYINII